MDNTHSLRVQCIALRQVMLVNAAKLHNEFHITKNHNKNFMAKVKGIITTTNEQTQDYVPGCNGKPYMEIVEIARKYILTHGGFEMFGEWGMS